MRDAILAIVDGRLDSAVTLSGRFVELGEASGVPVRGRQARLSTLIAPAPYLGRPDLWLTDFDEYASLLPSGLHAPNSINLTAARAMCLAQLGRIEEARALVGPLLDEVAWASAEVETPTQVIVRLLQAAVALEHRAAAKTLAGRLTCVAYLSIEFPVYTCIARHLGDAAGLAGDLASARTYYTQALEAARKIRFRPELALTHLRLVELLLEGEDDTVRAEGQEHLDIAIPELRDMKMQPALEQALSLLGQVERRTAVAASDGAASHTLTGRERDVARLLAAGRSNREIADTLVISEGTVEVHVKHILSKLGMRSRSQVAAWVADGRV
jgi:DNA-binding CsgD family transcriptional regulator